MKFCDINFNLHLVKSMSYPHKTQNRREHHMSIVSNLNMVSLQSASMDPKQDYNEVDLYYVLLQQEIFRIKK